MTPFSYLRAADEAAAQAAAATGAKFLGGGTNLVDLMRETIERPERLVDVSGLDARITAQDDGLRIGAAARNTAIAEHGLVRRDYPLLSRAILSGASGQIRNMATLGGNLLQRTRCPYFYDHAARCNKRMAGSGCDAREGFSRIHAVLGGSAQCVATHPSDLCVALAALDTRVLLRGAAGARAIPFAALHLPPGDTPQVEHVLAPDDLVTAIHLPALPSGARSTYRKVRDRASYAFALVSVAAWLRIEHGKVAALGLALGGVGTVPWRARLAEAALLGQDATAENFAAAASAEMAPAVALRDNGFKIEMARRVIVAVLGELSGEAA